MRGRPNNSNKIISRTKSPLLMASLSSLPIETKVQEKQRPQQKREGSHMGRTDLRQRVGSPDNSKQLRKGQGRAVAAKEQKPTGRESTARALKMEGLGKMVQEDEDDNTTEQSSSQHLSYVTGQYQLDSYDLFSRRKNVKFKEKVEDLSKAERQVGTSRTSSRNSSILKNSNRLLDHSLASSQKSISIQNSFTATRKCKIGLSAPQDNQNAIIKRKYEGIVEQLRYNRERRQGKEKYIDDLFPPVEASIFSISVHRKGNISKTKDEIVWMRLSQLFPAQTKVFSLNKTEADISIYKGEKGYADNYLVTSLNVIRGCSELLEHMFVNEEASSFGVYLVKIYQDNNWKYVIVDDLIPCVRRRGRGKQEDNYTPMFVNVTPPVDGRPLLWPFLLEKAYANYYSSYENMCYGNPVDFTAELTGSAYQQLTLVNKKMEKRTLENNLNAVGSAFSKEGVVGLGWNEEKGIFHAIHVLKQIFTGESIQLGLGDSSSDNLIQVQLSQLPHYLSTVYLFQFKQYTNHVTCPVYPPKVIKAKPKKAQHRVRYLQIPVNDTTSLRAFTLFKKTKCCLDLKQKDNRFYWQCGINQYLWVRCLLLQKEYDGGYRWISGKYCNQKHIVFEETLDAGEYLMVIMVEWREKYNRQLTAVLYSDSQYLKFERKNHSRDDRVIELACMDLAQRNGKLSQINKSICAYTYLSEETGLVIENICNERTKGEVTILRSVNGLKSKVEILPINQEFEVDAPQDYGSWEKGEGRKVIGQSVEIDIQKSQNFTVVLRMRGGVDRKFFRVFNFG